MLRIARPHLFAFLPLLVAGFASAIALAYAAAIFSPVMPPPVGLQVELFQPVPDPNWRWLVNRHHSIGHTCMVFRRASRDTPGGTLAFSTPLSASSYELPSWSAIPARGMKVDDHAFGWPLRCMRAVQYQPQDRTEFRVIQGWNASSGEIWLPRRVLPLPLLANSLILGAMLWALFIGPRLWRDLSRARRGQCLKCAYDLRATPVGSPCPECGSISEHARATPAPPF
ncbi:MAG: hypothetical protein KF869_01750 [Phycisphaeraceae bacterium]|nr:hypothetical protein [Phycisphaeraceae bacterium]